MGAYPRAGTLYPAVFLFLLESCSPAPARNTPTDVLKWTRGVYATDHLNIHNEAIEMRVIIHPHGTDKDIES